MSYCIECGATTKVIDSRPMHDQLGVRRRRQCDKCTTRFTTYEIPVSTYTNLVEEKRFMLNIANKIHSRFHIEVDRDD